MMLKRILSAIVAGIYLINAAIGGGSGGALRCVLFLILPMACIWFSDEMGSVTGVWMRGRYLDTETPGCLVAFGGWLVLLMPAIIRIIGYFWTG